MVRPVGVWAALFFAPVPWSAALRGASGLRAAPGVLCIGLAGSGVRVVAIFVRLPKLGVS